MIKKKRKEASWSLMNNYIPSLSSNNSDLQYKDCPIALIPHYKGYHYHVREIQSYLDHIGLPYEGAPTNFYEYLKHNNTKGYDIRVHLPNGKTLKIECKARYINYHIFDSSFEEEFLKKNCDILVINDPWVLTYKQKIRLRLKGIKLYSTSEFKAYISKLKHDLRIGLLNIIRYSICSFISSFISDTRGLSRITKLTRVKPKSIVTTGFHTFLPECSKCIDRENCGILEKLRDKTVQTTLTGSDRSPTRSVYKNSKRVESLRMMQSQLLTDKQFRCRMRRWHMEMDEHILLFEL